MIGLGLGILSAMPMIMRANVRSNILTSTLVQFKNIQNGNISMAPKDLNLRHIMVKHTVTEYDPPVYVGTGISHGNFVGPITSFPIGGGSETRTKNLSDFNCFKKYGNVIHDWAETSTPKSLYYFIMFFNFSVFENLKIYSNSIL